MLFAYGSTHLLFQWRMAQVPRIGRIAWSDISYVPTEVVSLRQIFQFLLQCSGPTFGHSIVEEKVPCRLLLRDWP